MESDSNKSLRVGFYCLTMFSDVYKEVTPFHDCQIFYGKRKLMPLALNTILVEVPFQQWGLDSIGQINPNYSGQHKWILTASDYFTKWIEDRPTRRNTYVAIMYFLENNILLKFGYPRRLVTDNAQAFKSKKMIIFCHKYHISLNHSTSIILKEMGLLNP